MSTPTNLSSHGQEKALDATTKIVTAAIAGKNIVPSTEVVIELVDSVYNKIEDLLLSNDSNTED